MISKQAKQTYNIVIPISVAGIVAFVVFRYTQKWQMVVAFSLIALIMTWAITARVTKTLSTPRPKDIDVNGSGNYTEEYDPTPLVEAIYSDIDCLFCTRNGKPYEQLLALPSVAFRKCADYWNKKYYSKSNTTLAQAIAGEESDFFTFENNFILDIQPKLAERFAAEGIV